MFCWRYRRVVRFSLRPHYSQRIKRIDDIMTILWAARSWVWFAAGTRYIFPPNARIDSGVHSTLYWIRTGAVLGNWKLITHHSLSLRWRMSGIIPPHPLYALMACKDSPLRVPCTQCGKVLKDSQLVRTFWPRMDPLSLVDSRKSVMQLVAIYVANCRCPLMPCRTKRDLYILLSSWDRRKSHSEITNCGRDVEVKQSRYRPGVPQRVPGS